MFRYNLYEYVSYEYNNEIILLNKEDYTQEQFKTICQLAYDEVGAFQLDIFKKISDILVKKYGFIYEILDEPISSCNICDLY